MTRKISNTKPNLKAGITSTTQGMFSFRTIMEEVNYSVIHMIPGSSFIALEGINIGNSINSNSRDELTILPGHTLVFNKFMNVGRIDNEIDTPYFHHDASFMLLQNSQYHLIFPSNLSIEFISNDAAIKTEIIGGSSLQDTY